ncbi:MAG: pirin family protein [Bacteroidales bacterium]|nr:pirin family protein [Bacteroidales bacterium]
MNKERTIITAVRGQRTHDGAGVSLVRVLGNETVQDFDPILMLDSFDTTDPKDFEAGFPTHPHRGIETVTFVAQGSIRHRDNLGNEATVGNGEAQWLTAGSGAFHSEFMSAEKRLLGVQLWLNLPQKDKMSAPAYHSIRNEDIKEFNFEGGKLRLLAGEYKGQKGYQGKYLPLDYYDIFLEPHATLELNILFESSVMAFTLQGEVKVGGATVDEKTAVKLSEGDKLTLSAGDKGAEVLVMISKALNEPVAWYGPIVMNTKEEIRTAVQELNNGTFVKVKTDYVDR